MRISFTDDLTIAACVAAVGVIWWHGRNPSTATLPTQAATPPVAQRVAIDPAADKWFATPNSVGSVAIGMAEGNYGLAINGQQVIVKTNPIYKGHRDPGNGVINYGFCSDQGRSGGDLQRADQGCLNRIRGKIPEAIADLKAAGIDPATDPEALVNTLDLHNQASPIHSRWFPKALARARAEGRQGVEAIAQSRTASFYQNGDPTTGRNMAGGLLGICRRENRGVSDFACVYGDQLRRARAINKAIAVFNQVNTTEGQRG